MEKAILLDIEGTTTPIDFVHKTLFPYARARMAGFVSDNFNDLKIEVAQLAEEHAAEGDNNVEFRPDSANSVSEYLNFLIDNDRKSTPLKSIQGMIWQTGYESGDLVSTVYADVPAAFKRWKDEGKTVAIYSSGSVLAQQLIFKYSDQGDLTHYIDRYFDTNVGHKREAESYCKIAEQLELQPDTILFVSDIPEELYAAAEVGMRVLLSVRPGNAPVAQKDRLTTITSFDEIDI
ncbi:MAG TPA: acireductone synthase [Pyrinomonadaceae bacterium]|nr:acireductone synthase [Pyrinomonadaceae bacterium]HMP65399.1 acireductone synthase [Pyrinomonadaceae bacterium]